MKLYLGAVAILAMACGPSAVGSTDAGPGDERPDAGFATADAGPVCTTGQTSCGQLDVLECVEGAWQPVETCEEGAKAHGA